MKHLQLAKKEATMKVSLRFGSPPLWSWAVASATFAFDPLPALARYEGPKLIVDTSPNEGPGALHNQVPQIEHRVIADTSHWPQLDDPKAFDRVLDEFLARVN